MKRNIILPLAAALLLGSCASLPNIGGSSYSGEIISVNIESSDDHDSDPIIDITSDETSFSGETQSSKMEETFSSEENISMPEGVIVVDPTTEIKTNGASYYIKGEFSDLMITAKKDSEIFVYLDGATITSNKGIAFGSEKAITLHLILVEGSINTISNDYKVEGELEESNAFHVKGNVIISGTGTLNVNSTVKNGLKASKALTVCEGVKLNVTGANHAISALSFAAKGAKITANSKGKDGINSECDGEISTYTTEQGYVYIEDCEVTIDSYGDGIQAATYVYIAGGKTNITTHGEFIAYSSSLISSGEYTKDDFKFEKSGSTYVRKASDEIRYISSMYALKNSVKGIKVAGVEYEDGDGNVKEVTAGDYLIDICHLAEVNINSTDDCIHSNYGKVSLNSANLELASFDDGVHADYDLNVNNCSINITSSYEGLEGANVTIDGANTNIVSVSSDDGINAASSYGSSHNIYINDGYFRVYASGDGLDANTGLYLNGGTVIVEGPGRNNGSLDAERVYFNGGTVFACSTSGMIEQMTAKQSTFIYQGNTTFGAGSQVSIVDSGNNSLFTYTLKQSCTQIIFSSSSMNVGSSYKIVKGSTSVATINLSSTLTRVGTSGGQGGGPGGGPGGR